MRGLRPPRAPPTDRGRLAAEILSPPICFRSYMRIVVPNPHLPLNRFSRYSLGRVGNRVGQPWIIFITYELRRELRDSPKHF